MNGATATQRRAPGRTPLDRDRRIVRALSAWFLGNQRDLPWRRVDPATGKRDAYRSLVSEVMLQQTQVSRVLEKFEPFLKRFPTAAALARAHEDEVLSAWTGLGYYRRARLLHSAAKAVVERHDGRLPEALEELRALPGVGRYTAGAVASMAMGQCAPLVDTNVSRVLLRVDGKELGVKEAEGWVWERAEALAEKAHADAKANGAGVFNEAMMELGGLVCVSGTPRCGVCPLAKGLCVARARGIETEIPRIATKKARTAVTHAVVVVRDSAGRLLVERRKDTGLWAGLWQAPTLELPAGAKVPGVRSLAKSLGLPGECGAKKREEFVFNTTHKEVRFVVNEAVATDSAAPRRWVTSRQARALGMSSPMRRIVFRATST